jgi:HD superfamily phosphohydrolase
MKQIINHFQEVLRDMNKSISDDEKNLALAAALLHDIGHGPFSHGFEGIIPGVDPKDHESWTTEIIASEKTELNNVLKQVFSDQFPDKVAGLIDNNLYLHGPYSPGLTEDGYKVYNYMGFKNGNHP